ncbi:MAG: hypothetical protein NZ941_00970 [Candidatus Caldarchaeum sp.]|nr:hypothetical protein [Candidatus Caldarchaeum sp.]
MQLKSYLITSMAVLAASLMQCFPMFTGRLTWNTASIEPAYIIQARLLQENWPTPGWNPLWYGGHPFKLAYHPAFLFIVNAVAFVLDTDVVEAYRRVAGLSLILLPLSIHFFVASLSRSPYVGFLASLAYISFPSIHRTVYTYPAAAAAPEHVNVVSLYGETPHILGLATAFTAATLYHLYTQSGRRALGLAATLTISLVFLTNLIAAVSLIVLLFSAAVISGWDDFKKFLMMVFLGLGACLFVYDYEYLHALVAYAGITASAMPITLAHAALILIILSAAFASARIINQKTDNKLIPTTLMLTAVFTTVLVFNRLLGIQILPQAVRYGPELDAAILALAVSTALTLAGKSKVRALMAVIVLVLSAAAYFQSLPTVWQLLRPGDSEVIDSYEMRIAEYVKKLPGDVFGPRVYATGSLAFWLNLYVDKPQVRGGFDAAGSVKPMWNHVAYLVNTSPNGTLSVNWLKAFNVKYVVVDMPSTPLPYKDYRYPEKFENLLSLLADIDGVKIYEINSDFNVLQLVKKTDKVPVLEEISNLNALYNYLEITANSCSAELRYEVLSSNLVKVEVDSLNEACLLIFKINYDSRWRTHVNGVEIYPEKIGPGFIYFDISEVRGRAELTIGYVGENFSDWLFNILSLAALGAALFMYIKHGRSFTGFKKQVQA